ncbi:13905_t:CDS:2 [Cetraspora pellucida]|uniref:13905_t:CDS:1 n=1 Tax=Cetraspora pellucida TaxID=1433469 RepID=A0A9N9G7V0_9GLOM|nr:13905_t:CDS:2 [Cetraspora pellucida]
MNETFELSTEDFNKQLSKPQESSGRKKNVLSENLRITWKKPTINCEARIRITWLAASNMVRIERVSGTFNHSHLMEENYKPPMIADVIRKEASKLYEDSGVEYLKTKEVTNIKQKLVGPMNLHLVGDANLKPDILNTIKFLIENNYQVESFQKQESLEHLRGLCFANFWQIENLTRYGWLMLMDSTHNTNKHGWHLFTLYIRDSCGCWNVSAHFFVNRENSKAVMSALKIVQKFALQWNPQYMLLDQSSIESNGIALTFPAGCEEIVCDAINICSIQANAKYIARNYLKNSRQWSLWAQQHSPLLLQITSTNPLESYYSELKAKISVQYGFISEYFL